MHTQHNCKTKVTATDNKEWDADLKKQSGYGEAVLKVIPIRH